MWLVVVLFLLKSGVFALSHALQEKSAASLVGVIKRLTQL